MALIQGENTPNRFANNHSLPYIRELPDVCLLQASLAGVTMRREIQPGCCQLCKAMSYTFSQWRRSQPFPPDWKLGTIWHLFLKDVTEVSFKVTKWFPHLPFGTRQLLILSSGKKFEGKSFLSEVHIYWIPVCKTKLNACGSYRWDCLRLWSKYRGGGNWFFFFNAKKTQTGSRRKISSLTLSFSSFYFHFKPPFQ